MSPSSRAQLNIRLTSEDEALLAELAQRLGLDRTAVVRLALRTLASAVMPARGRTTKAV